MVVAFGPAYLVRGVIVADNVGYREHQVQFEKQCFMDAGSSMETPPLALWMGKRSAIDSRLVSFSGPPSVYEIVLIHLRLPPRMCPILHRSTDGGSVLM